MMPKLLPSRPSPPCSTALRAVLHGNKTSAAHTRASISRPRLRQIFNSTPARPLAQPHHGLLSEPWPPSGSPATLFSYSGPPWSIADDSGEPGKDHQPPDERILKLGKTLRMISPLLPTLLINPLPPKILSPSVTLHLFPSTHPHLPTVKGRTLYRAALWTVPVAWSAIPLVGNVQLQILSERIVRAGTVLDPNSSTREDSSDERLVVRWRTEPRGDEHRSYHDNQTPAHDVARDSKPGVNNGLSALLGGDAPIFPLGKEEQFTGLFIFSFDEEGRVASHTIEHAEDAGGWDRTPKFVTLTDWLIGKARGSLDPGRQEPGLVMQGCYSFAEERRRGRT